ncbi:MAG: hypothetical protein LBT50_10590 [Prevotellaceae bacterium]|nr:hypothetical protein [Prevotellaceae bacterium]
MFSKTEAVRYRPRLDGSDLKEGFERTICLRLLMTSGRNIKNENVSGCS